MKTGLSITQMAQELERQQNAKRDFIADTRQLAVQANNGTPTFTINMGGERQEFGAGQFFRQQAAEHYKIPRDFAERIRTAHPDVWEHTFNSFLQREPARRMVRVLDNNGRAFLSDRFRPLDNFDLAQAVLEKVMGIPQVRLESSQFTDARFYMKFVFPRIETEVKVGDAVQLGLTISNSEVGCGSLSVQPFTLRLICMNGAVVPDAGKKSYHVGRRAADEDAAYELYTDKTKQLDSVAFFAKIRDLVGSLLTRETLERAANRMREATEQKITGVNIVNVVEVTAKKLGYSEATKMGVLQHLIQGGDLTRYGLMNAITRQSQDEEDYETATQLERDGGRIIELPQGEWKQIADAALLKAA